VFNKKLKELIKGLTNKLNEANLEIIRYLGDKQDLNAANNKLHIKNAEKAVMIIGLQEDIIKLQATLKTWEQMVFDLGKDYEAAMSKYEKLKDSVDR